MSRRKNNIRAKIRTCFLCGLEFESSEQKILHRINKGKNSSQNNVVVICENCRKHIQVHYDGDIWKLYSPISVRKKYFSILGNKYRTTIMSKIRYFKYKDKYDGKEN